MTDFNESARSINVVSRISHAKDDTNPSTTSTSWAQVPNLSLTLNLEVGRNVRFDLSGMTGKAESGMVQFALFRDGNLLEVGPAVYHNNLSADLIPVSCFWIDAAHGGGQHTYDIRWKVWSGTAHLGRRADKQYVTNVPSYFIATEYAP